MESPVNRILYIGTDQSIEKQLKEDQNTEVISKENAILAYNWLEKNLADAILCEINLPGANGFDVNRNLRDKLKDKKIPIILLHHENDNDIRNNAIHEKVDDLYIKPLNTNNLVNRINTLVNYDLMGKHPTTDISSALPQYKIPVAKRIFDIIVAGTALLMLSPLLIIVMLAIRLESKGKIYYISKRVGTGYKIFDFYKFRSMYTGADKKLKDLEHLNQYSKQKDQGEKEHSENHCPECSRLGHPCSTMLVIDGHEICENLYLKKKKEEQASAFKKIKNDPRVTKVGNIIRNTSIDELPQLINVIKGDMSIVGNRPLPLYEAEQLTSDQWSERFLAPAGITGLWQVELRGRKGDMSEEERKELDNCYARNYSFWGDIKLIARTIPALLQEEKV